MSVSDAILIGEDWISEHYFTTDAKSQSFRARVIARRKEWDGNQDDGSSTRSRFTAARTELLAQFAALADDTMPAADVRDRLVRTLGFDAIGLVPDVSGPLTTVRQASLPDGPSVAIVAAKAVDSVEGLLAKNAETLVEPYEVDEATQITSVAQLLTAQFVGESAPDFALVLGGRFALVAERVRWPEGRYLAIDLQLVCERNDDRRGGEIDTALACLAADSLAPDAEGNIWWHGVLEESVKHTVGVSQDLREGVRLSIEIIANDVVARRAQKGLEALPPAEAQTLAKQSLRFLYRILFLLYAEASPELGVLPTGAPEYEQGYSLDRLRDLIQTPLHSPHAQQGTHLYDSLSVLFRLVDKGHEPASSDDDEGLLEALSFRALRADLFQPEATALIDEVRLSNAELQRVLQHLLLSKEKKGADRGFISYAELGINQLGAVYEGLMSYTGRFADTDLFEVAKGGDGSKGSWLVPVDRAGSIDEKDFVRTEDPTTGEFQPVLHRNGTFVFRLAGRERQQSASYYTPEVLTRFTVDQALQELLDQDGQTTTAAEILEMTVCEPALGSGAFAIEAVRQLAAEYLARRRNELGRSIDPDEYPKELQRVKAYLALHNVYGVDLNSTAVELAEISLWLDTMVEGLQAPWFGLHLRRGNSLVGARHAVFTRAQLDKKAWLKGVPQDVPMTDMPAEAADGRIGKTDGRIHHFLLPADGWGSAIKSKEANALAPEALDRLKAWRRRVLVKPTKQQADALVSLGRRAETLWQIAWRRLAIAESEIRRSIEIWGADDLPVGGAVTREQIEESLADPNSAYRRLRRAMDAWNALWFWPLTEDSTPPDLDDWIATLEKLLGLAGTAKGSRPGQLGFGSGSAWAELGQAESHDLAFAGVADVAQVLAEHPWLAVAERVAERQGFFHWELDFAPVFTRGGFDLQAGNPPWVRPRSDVEALLAEADPWWQLKSKSTASEDAEHRAFALSIPGTVELVLDGTSDVAATAAFVGATAQYPHLAGLQPDLYRCFMEQTWRHAKPTGSVGLIHPETHFTDEKAGPLRAATYRRLRRHWQFINELSLFEVHHLVSYGVHIYGAEGDPSFLMATSLYHPDTIERSLKHDGSGSEPGLKDDEGNWDLRPHASRIQRVELATLRTWHAVLESDDVPVAQSRMVYTVNRSTAAVLDKLAAAPRIGDLGLSFSAGWHEKNDRTKGFFDSEWGVPESWDSVILQGPHIHVATPFYKQPNPTMKHNQDWTAVDLEALPPDAIPATSYKPRGDRTKYDDAYTHWETSSELRAARSQFRIAYRAMAANTGERTLAPALIPPGASHVNGMFAIGLPGRESSLLVAVAASASSLIADLAVRAVPKSGIYQGVFERLPFVEDVRIQQQLHLRLLRLTAVTETYAALWKRTFQPEFLNDEWAVPDSGTSVELAAVGPTWAPEVPLRRALDRRQAMLEIDALVAVALGVTATELVTIYRTQFPVLAGYDRNTYVYDRNGRLLPNSVLAAWRKAGDGAAPEDRTAAHPGSGVTYEYLPPFAPRDREADLRQAHAEFSRRAASRRSNSA
jgi:hypothetical protein